MKNWDKKNVNSRTFKIINNNNFKKNFFFLNILFVEKYEKCFLQSLYFLNINKKAIII